MISSIGENEDNNNLIFNQIEQNIRQNANQAIGLQVFRAQNDKITDASLLNQLDTSFMYSQLIKEMLIDAEVEYAEDNINDFVDICLAENQDNQMQSENLRSFRNTYKQHSSVWCRDGQLRPFLAPAPLQLRSE
ncbi:unnamed protein product [Rotaria socialis]|uniref:Uncharacterized protein n=1 Tax=Rotaria socialis TaxID=392032 RepID=A0A818A6H9_9BILA|nr:unnamed protein product [Rotaria socialis]